MGQDGFFSCYFSNATYLGYQFAKNNYFPVGNIHIYLQYEHIKHMLTQFNGVQFESFPYGGALPQVTLLGSLTPKLHLCRALKTRNGRVKTVCVVIPVDVFRSVNSY